MTSLILDVRDHIGGNCYDYVTKDGLRASKYGAHLFHTKFPRVWDYVTQFSEWLPFDHRVKGMVPDKDGVKKLVPIPPTQETVNTLFGESIDSEEKMQQWYEKNRVAPASGEAPRSWAGGAAQTSWGRSSAPTVRRDSRRRARMAVAVADPTRCCTRQWRTW